MVVCGVLCSGFCNVLQCACEPEIHGIFALSLHIVLACVCCARRLCIKYENVCSRVGRRILHRVVRQAWPKSVVFLLS